MALDSVTVNNGSADFNYVQISLNGTEAIYRDDSSSLQNPRTLRVSHENAKAPDGTDRHLVQLVRVDDDADGVPYTGTVHVVLAVPREGVSQADMLLEFNKLKDVVTDFWDEIIAGFFPG